MVMIRLLSADISPNPEAKDFGWKEMGDSPKRNDICKITKILFKV
jgi:hypothetical protein